MRLPPAFVAAAVIVGACSTSADFVPSSAIVNPSFEQQWTSWRPVDTSSASAGAELSTEAHDGSRAVKLTEKKAFISQDVPVEPGSTYRLSAFVQGMGNLGVKVGPGLYFDQVRRKRRGWHELTVVFQTEGASRVTVFCSAAEPPVYCDDFRLFSATANTARTSPRLIASSAGGYGLSPDLSPGQNFDLLGWYLNTPADKDGNGKADRFSEVQLQQGATDPAYFYTADDGGMVFRATIRGARTSKNTRFTRTELREMLRRGQKNIDTKTNDGRPNKNNWVFSTAPAPAKALAGAVDGTLRATLAVNHVTTSGDRSQVGRVIIGQIHAKNDEPVRLYYRKLPGHDRGSVYFAHEPSKGDDIWVELIGSRSSSASSPDDGIALNEKFSYEIDVKGHRLRVTISKESQTLAERTLDMSGSGYAVDDDYMYFKAGVYNQNNTGEPNDYVQATFYRLQTLHGSE